MANLSALGMRPHPLHPHAICLCSSPLLIVEHEARPTNGTVVQVFGLTRPGIQPSPAASDVHSQPNVPHGRYQKMVKSHSIISEDIKRNSALEHQTMFML